MQATIDGYAQMRVFLRKKDVSILKKYGVITGEVWRTEGGLLPLRMYLKKDIIYMRAEGVPTDKPGDEKTAYEIDINPPALRLIEKRKFVGSNFPTIRLREAIISLEDVY